MKLLNKSFQFSLSDEECKSILAEVNKLYPDGTEHEELNVISKLLNNEEFNMAEMPSMLSELNGMDISDEETPVLSKIHFWLLFAKSTRFIAVPKMRFEEFEEFENKENEED